MGQEWQDLDNEQKQMFEKQFVDKLRSQSDVRTESRQSMLPSQYDYDAESSKFRLFGETSNASIR